MPDLPVRYCHGCKTYDDAPRFTHIVGVDRPDLDTLHHYDEECHPPGFVIDGSPLAPIVEARKAGKKDADLREIAAAHAASIQEAPADKNKGA